MDVNVDIHQNTHTTHLHQYGIEFQQVSEGQLYGLETKQGSGQ